jgi:1,2-diacylglycerol 3-beta-glucosyltransferase
MLLLKISLIMTFLLAILIGLVSFFTLYLAVFAVAAMMGKKTKIAPKNEKKRRFAVFLPAYKEDAVIVASAQNALQQQYPAELMEVIVIADGLKAETLQALKELPIQTVEVQFETSTKSKALNAAMKFLSSKYTENYFDVALVLDADNHLEPQFLRKINAAFDQGWRVVQGHRTAKNTDTTTALLDAVSEEINNHIFRLGHRALGLSCALIGSGMAFEYPLFKSLMADIQTTGGFDKELEMRLLSQKIGVEYVEDAYCYDEKVRNAEVFERQRTRWIAAQIKYLKHNFGAGVQAFLRGNFDYADKVFQTLIPPRILLLGVSGMVWLLALLSQTFLLFSTLQIVVLGATLVVAIPASLRAQIGWKELESLPKLFFKFLVSFTKIKEAQKKFIHTPHG